MASWTLGLPRFLTNLGSSFIWPTYQGIALPQVPLHRQSIRNRVRRALWPGFFLVPSSVWCLPVLLLCLCLAGMDFAGRLPVDFDFGDSTSICSVSVPFVDYTFVAASCCCTPMRFHLAALFGPCSRITLLCSLQSVESWA